MQPAAKRFGAVAYSHNCLSRCNHSSRCGRALESCFAKADSLSIAAQTRTADPHFWYAEGLVGGRSQARQQAAPSWAAGRVLHAFVDLRPSNLNDLFRVRATHRHGVRAAEDHNKATAH